MNRVLTADDGKRWNWGASALLTAFVMTVPTLVVILLGGSTAGAPVVWVRTAMAGFRQGNQVFPQRMRMFVHGKTTIYN